MEKKQYPKSEMEREGERRIEDYQDAKEKGSCATPHFLFLSGDEKDYINM